MNIFWRELKTLRRSTVIWTLSLCGLAVMFLAVYPGMTSDIDNFKTLLNEYPPTVQAMLGINLEYIESLVGFYAMVYSFVLLCGSIQAMNFGLSVLSREGRERTSDFLLSKPVSRFTIVTAKLMAALIAIGLSDLVFYLVSYGMAEAVTDNAFSRKQFFLLSLTLTLIQLIFFTFGTVLSVLLKKVRSVPGLSIGIVFGFYMLGALIAVGKDAGAERYLSPFRYFEPSYIFEHTAYEPSFLLAGGCLAAAAILGTYIVYIKKDIQTVA